MMRGIFGAPEMRGEVQEYYAGLMKKGFDLQDFQDFLRKNVLDAKYLKGEDFAKWVGSYNRLHAGVINKAGWAKESTARLGK